MIECLVGFKVVGIKANDGELECIGKQDIRVRSLICMGSITVGYLRLKCFCMGSIRGCVVSFSFLFFLG